MTRAEQKRMMASSANASANNMAMLPMPDQTPDLTAGFRGSGPTVEVFRQPRQQPTRAVAKPKPSRWKPGERTNRVVTTLGSLAGGALGGPIGGLAGGPLARGGLALYRRLLAGRGTGGGRSGQQTGPQVPYSFSGFNQLGQGIQTSPAGRRSVIPRAAPVDPNVPVTFSSGGRTFSGRAGNSGFGVGGDGRSIVGFNSSGQPLFQGAPPDVVKAAGLYSPVNAAEATNQVDPDERYITVTDPVTGEDTYRYPMQATPAMRAAGLERQRAGRATVQAQLRQVHTPESAALYRQPIGRAGNQPTGRRMDPSQARMAELRRLMENRRLAPKLGPG